MEFTHSDLSDENEESALKPPDGKVVFSIDKIENINRKLNAISSRETAVSSSHLPHKIDTLFSQLINHLSEVNAEEAQPLVKCFKNFHEEFKRVSARSSERNNQGKPPSIP